MKKHIILLLCLLDAIIAYPSSVVLDNIKFTLQGNRGFSCKAINKNDLTHVEIPEYITLDGFEYPVIEIETRGFEGCKNLESIVLPNTISKIGAQAFWNCKNLRNIVMPDDADVKIYTGNYGYGDKGIFSNCVSLSQMRGHNILYPYYMLYEALYKCEEVPFYGTIQKTGASAMIAMKIHKSFREYALEKIKEPIEQWQKKKEYETISQWESRVTEANRKKMIDEAIAVARTTYIETFASPHLTGGIEEFDTDYGFYPIEINSFGTIYVSVSQDKALEFKNNWSKVDIEPTYGIIDDELGILSCKFVLGDNIYYSYNSIDEDDLSNVILNLTPISAIREYEEMLANESAGRQVKKYFDPDVVDINIPVSDNDASKTFAIIIGNENYQRVAPVDFAMNDARIFAKYCNKTLGIPENNIRAYYDATYGDILAAMDDVKSISDAYEGDIKIIFYYAGHGLPDEDTRNAYLIPIDSNGIQLEACYELKTLYQQLGNLNSKSVVCFIDACFSGSLRGDGMLVSSRGVKLKPRDIPAEGNMIVLSAASYNQSAFPYNEKNHGLFTYYLIKKLHETSGKVNLGDLTDYIITEVSRQSIVDYKKTQTPNVRISNNIVDTWRDIVL